MRWVLLFTAAGLLVACGGPRYHRVYPPPEDLRHSPAKLKAAAYAYYNRGDYVRALRYAYEAAQTTPDDLRSSFLLGLIYDMGLDRPDLAIPEYKRILSLRPWSDLPKRIRRRIHYLYRQAQARHAARALHPGSPPPISSDQLAAFPLYPAGPRPPDPNLQLGLIDLLLYDLQNLSDTLHIDPLQVYISSYTFQRAHPGATPGEFARWSGAEKTLTGTLIDLGEGRIRVVLHLLGSDGSPLYTAAPVTGNLRDLQTLHHALLSQAAKALDLSLPATLPPLPVAALLPLLLHAEGLWVYLSGQVSEAHHHLAQTQTLDPASDLIARTYRWVDLDLTGQKEGQSLLVTYRSMVAHPSP